MPELHFNLYTHCYVTSEIVFLNDLLLFVFNKESFNQFIIVISIFALYLKMFTNISF